MPEATYRTDLAYIHARGFGWYALQSAPGMLSLLRKNGVTEGLVVDLGCGNGIWPQRLAWAGYRALGLDTSPAMIRLARKQVPEARFEVADVTRFPIPHCVAVTSLGEALSYAFEADGTGKLLQSLFRRVHRALSPGGVFVFDIGIQGREPGGMPRSGHWLGEDWAVTLNSEENGTLLTRRLTSFRKVGKAYRRREETHRLRLYAPAAIESGLSDAGFLVRRLKRIGEVRFQSGHAGFLATKPVV